jgi:uncharacterized LabA/DUF88 family protein
MFRPSTSRIQKIAERFPAAIASLQSVFDQENITYIDWGNVRNWSNRLGWHVCQRRLYQFMRSFDGPTTPKLYYGCDQGVAESHAFIQSAKQIGYEVHTKSVKHIRLTIDVSSISAESPDIIKNFIFGRLLNTFSVEMIKQLNDHLRELNRKGIDFFEDLKCNFDVEIGRDMLADAVLSGANSYTLWSGDSDFADPVKDLLAQRKSVTVFGTSGMISRELNQLRAQGLQIFDVKKIKEYICWAKELPDDLK